MSGILKKVRILNFKYRPKENRWIQHSICIAKQVELNYFEELILQERTCVDAGHGIIGDARK